VIFLKFLSERKIERNGGNILIIFGVKIYHLKYHPARVTVFEDSRFSLPYSGESRFTLRHPCLFPEIFSRCGLRLFFHPRGKPLPWGAATEIEQFERAASCWCHRKNITRDWERIFEFGYAFFKNHWSIRVDYDGKKMY